MSLLTVGYVWLIDYLKSSQWRIPDDLGVLLICSHELTPNYTSIDEAPYATGASAIDLLSGQLYRNEYGIPEHPKLLLTEPKWAEGNTLIENVKENVISKPSIDVSVR